MARQHEQPHSGHPSNFGSSTTVFHESWFKLKIHAAVHNPEHKPSHLSHTVLVRDPPRTKLHPGFSVHLFEEDPQTLTLTRFTGEPEMTELYITSWDQQKLFPEEGNHFYPTDVIPSLGTMTRKRRSLSNLLIHPFLKTSEDHHIATSPYIHDLTSSSPLSDSGHDLPYPQVLNDVQELVVSPLASRGSSPPPDFLLDDDPFANYTAPVITTPSTKSTPSIEPIDPKETSPPNPRSPLSPTRAEGGSPGLPSPPRAAPPTVTRAHSGRVRPAYQRPAFAPRPSLPSLDALAQMNHVVLPRKPRKGRVGAKLPFEPWDNLSSDDGSLSGCSSQESVVLEDSITELSAKSVTNGCPSDFVAELEADFDESFGDEYDGPHAEFFSSAPGPSSELSTVLQRTSASSCDEEESLSEISYLSDSDTPVEEIEGEGLLPIAKSSSSSSCVMPPLTRTTSATSTSSSEFDHEFAWPQSSSSHETSLSSAEDSDILESYLAPRTLSYFPSVANTQMSWSPIELYDSLKEPSFTDRLLSPTKQLEETCEVGTSANTIRPSSILDARHATHVESDEEAADASGYDGHRNYGGGSRGLGSYSNGESGAGRWGYGQSHLGGGGASGRGGAGGRDGDDGRDPRPPFSAISELDSESSSSEASETDDDVPIAQSIPGALKAQKSLRQQVRHEHKKRKQEKALKSATSSKSPARLARPMPRPPGAGAGEPLYGGGSSSQEASLHAVRSKSVGYPATADSANTHDELTRQLSSMQVDNAAPSGHVRQRAGSIGHVLREPSTRRAASPARSPAVDNSRILRPMHSFHRHEKKRVADEHDMAPMPEDARALGRSLTRIDHKKSDAPEYARPPRKSMEETRRIAKYPAESRSARSSSELERPPRSGVQRPPMPPLPSAEVITTVSPPQMQPVVPPQQGAAPTGKGVQQRVFIGDMQRFNMVEITNATSAGDVIEMVEAQGSLEGWVGSGGWMVWEIAHDFGMERPIRSYELLSDIQSSWNQDKMLNSFVIRITPLAAPLSRTAMPSASPTHAGYVEWEVKRGKWNKRWLRLREHSLWLSKRDNGRDEVLLCSLSNFDAYFITRPYKSPKAFTFAVKSTDNLSYFENTNDYLHIFSCSEKDGNAWMEKILVARSYVLHQERNVLFNPKANTGISIPAPGAASNLTRAATRRGPQAPRPAQPFVSLATPEPAMHHPPHSDNVFRVGSLLRKA